MEIRENGVSGAADASVRIAVPDHEVERFCRRHRVRELALFGSVLRGDFASHSDVDVLVEFFPHTPLKFSDLAQMEDELESMFHRKVDLILKDTLSRYIAEDVLRERHVLYVVPN